MPRDIYVESLQDIVDLNWRHFVKNRHGRAISDDGHCQTMVMGKPHLRCAVGICASPSFIKSANQCSDMGYQANYEISQKIQKSIGSWGQSLLDKLRKAHDDSTSWGGGSLRSRMDNAIRDCCVKYNLKYPGDTP